MFRTLTFLSMCLVACTLILAGYLHTTLRDEDAHLYQQLVQESAALHTQSALEKAPMHQLRNQVRKDLWIVKEGQRQHLLIESAKSELTIAQKKEQVEIVERLYEIDCHELSSSLPRRFQAKTGFFQFPSGQWTAEIVQIEHPTGELNASAISFDRQTQQLTYFLPKGHIKEYRTSFAADQGLTRFGNDLHSKILFLSGNVRILSSFFQNRESLALAETAEFQMKEKTGTLKALPSKRVLFWQKGLELSASEIHIRDTVQGIGDVHGAFDPEEKNLIERVFAKYL
ncbi:MAG: hypothetical protein HY861_04000 [Chlamydiia bacterium]|nr:hypothetical protein [Chlamydiia bacterium]